MTKWEQIEHKIATQEEAQTVVSSWKDNDEKVIFTNGCFDILHRGHVVYLAKAASLGDYLVVGVNSDQSVKSQKKGSNRPINDENSRALLVAALEVVDLVVIFENETPKALIETITPSVLVKGADYNAEEKNEASPQYIVGSKEVRAAGGKVATIELEAGYSTTNIIKKITS